MQPSQRVAEGKVGISSPGKARGFSTTAPVFVPSSRSSSSFTTAPIISKPVLQPQGSGSSTLSSASLALIELPPRITAPLYSAEQRKISDLLFQQKAIQTSLGENPGPTYVFRTIDLLNALIDDPNINQFIAGFAITGGTAIDPLRSSSDIDLVVFLNERLPKSAVMGFQELFNAALFYAIATISRVDVSIAACGLPPTFISHPIYENKHPVYAQPCGLRFRLGDSAHGSDLSFICPESNFQPFFSRNDAVFIPLSFRDIKGLIGQSTLSSETLAYRCRYQNSFSEAAALRSFVTLPSPRIAAPLQIFVRDYTRGRFPSDPNYPPLTVQPGLISCFLESTNREEVRKKQRHPNIAERFSHHLENLLDHFPVFPDLPRPNPRFLQAQLKNIELQLVSLLNMYKIMNSAPMLEDLAIYNLVLQAKISVLFRAFVAKKRLNSVQLANFQTPDQIFAYFQTNSGLLTNARLITELNLPIEIRITNFFQVMGDLLKKQKVSFAILQESFNSFALFLDFEAKKTGDFRLNQRIVDSFNQIEILGANPVLLWQSMLEVVINYYTSQIDKGVAVQQAQLQSLYHELERISNTLFPGGNIWGIVAPKIGSQLARLAIPPVLHHEVLPPVSLAPQGLLPTPIGPSLVPDGPVPQPAEPKDEEVDEPGSDKGSVVSDEDAVDHTGDLERAKVRYLRSKGVETSGAYFKAELTRTLQAKHKQLGVAIDNGDCFYDSLAQTINALPSATRPANPVRPGQVFTIKDLRLICAQYAAEEPAWLVAYINREQGGLEKFAEYKAKVAFTQNEFNARRELDPKDSQYAIWGRHNIEGQIIAARLGLQIKLTEVDLNPVDFNHLEPTDAWNSEPEEGILQFRDIPRDLSHAPIIEIAIYPGHYMPILPALLLPEALPDEPKPVPPDANPGVPVPVVLNYAAIARNALSRSTAKPKAKKSASPGVPAPLPGGSTLRTASIVPTSLPVAPSLRLSSPAVDLRSTLVSPPAPKTVETDETQWHQVKRRGPGRPIPAPPQALLMAQSMVSSSASAATEVKAPKPITDEPISALISGRGASAASNPPPQASRLTEVANTSSAEVTEPKKSKKREKKLQAEETGSTAVVLATLESPNQPPVKAVESRGTLLAEGDEELEEAEKEAGSVPGESAAALAKREKNRRKRERKKARLALAPSTAPPPDEPKDTPSLRVPSAQPVVERVAPPSSSSSLPSSVDPDLSSSVVTLASKKLEAILATLNEKMSVPGLFLSQIAEQSLPPKTVVDLATDPARFSFRLRSVNKIIYCNSQVQRLRKEGKINTPEYVKAWFDAATAVTELGDHHAATFFWLETIFSYLDATEHPRGIERSVILTALRDSFSQINCISQTEKVELYKFLQQNLFKNKELCKTKLFPLASKLLTAAFNQQLAINHVFSATLHTDVPEDHVLYGFFLSAIVSEIAPYLANDEEARQVAHYPHLPVFAPYDSTLESRQIKVTHLETALMMVNDMGADHYRVLYFNILNQLGDEYAAIGKHYLETSQLPLANDFFQKAVNFCFLIAKSYLECRGFPLILEVQFLFKKALSLSAVIIDIARAQGNFHRTTYMNIFALHLRNLIVEMYEKFGPMILQQLETDTVHKPVLKAKLREELQGISTLKAESEASRKSIEEQVTELATRPPREGGPTIAEIRQLSRLRILLSVKAAPFVCVDEISM